MPEEGAKERVRGVLQLPKVTCKYPSEMMMKRCLPDESGGGLNGMEIPIEFCTNKCMRLVC